MAFRILSKSLFVSINRRPYRQFIDFDGYRFICKLECDPYDNQIGIHITESLNRKEILSPEDIHFHVKHNCTILFSKLLCIDECIKFAFFLNKYNELHNKQIELLFEQKYYI